MAKKNNKSLIAKLWNLFKRKKKDGPQEATSITQAEEGLTAPSIETIPTSVPEEKEPASIQESAITSSEESADSMGEEPLEQIDIEHVTTKTPESNVVSKRPPSLAEMDLALARAEEVFSSRNDNQIKEYFETEFERLPSLTKFYILKYTSSTPYFRREVDGKSVFEYAKNGEVKNLLTDYIEDTDEFKISSTDIAFIAKSLMQFGASIYALPSIYIHNAPYTTDEAIVKDIKDLDQYSYSAEHNGKDVYIPYFGLTNLEILLKTYYQRTSSTHGTADRVEDFMGFYETFNRITKKSEVLQYKASRFEVGQIPIPDLVRIYFEYDDLTAEEIKTLISRPELREAFFDDDGNGLNQLLELTRNMEPQEELKVLSNFVQHPNYQQTEKNTATILSLLKGCFNTERDEILNIEITRPIFEKLTAYNDWFIAVQDDKETEAVKEILNLNRQKYINDATKVISSNDVNQIKDYLNFEFFFLPDQIKKEIFHATVSLTVNGENIYKYYDHSFMDFFTIEEPKTISPETIVSSAKVLMRNKLGSMDSEYIVNGYIENVHYSSPDEFLVDLEEIFNLTRPDTVFNDGGVYFQEFQVGKLIAKFVESQSVAVKNGGTIKNLTDLKAYRELLLHAQDLANNHFKTELVERAGMYRDHFFGGENDYELALYLANTIERIKDNDFQKLVFIANVVPKENSLKHVATFLKEHNLTLDNIQKEYLAKLLKPEVGKDERLNFEVSLPFFECLINNDFTIAECFSPLIGARTGQSYQFRSFWKGVEKEKLTNADGSPLLPQDRQQKIMEMANNYAEFGLIDDNTFLRVLEIAQKFNPGLTLEKVKETAKTNLNLRLIVEDISFASRTPVYVGDFMENGDEIAEELGINLGTFGGYPEHVSFNDNFISMQLMGEDARYPSTAKSPYHRALYDLETIYPKTRLQSLPEYHAYKKMDLNQKANFNLKVWNKFACLSLFNKDENTKQALVELLAVMGLFLKDDQVDARREQVYKLVSKSGETLSKEEFERSNLLSIFRTHFLADKGYTMSDGEVIKQFFTVKIGKKYVIRPGVSIPEELEGLFRESMQTGTVGPAYFAELKSLTGSFGKRVNDFLSPYTRDCDTYKLKHGVEIPRDLREALKPELSIEEYNKCLDLPTTSQFLNPVKEEEIKVLTLKKDVPASTREEIKKEILGLDIEGSLNFASIHRMFDGLKQTYNPEFYQLLMRDFDVMLESKVRQSQLKAVQEALPKAKRYYRERGKADVTTLDVLTYLDETLFAYKYGNKEFATEVKNAGVKSPEVYKYYENLLEAMKKRKKSTIPRHEAVYTYKTEDGKEYKVLTKILRLDDPLNMLVGESNFTNCCQVYKNAGEQCMHHAATSKDGGIFATYLLDENGVPQMLTQSWIWSKEAKLCLDNVEATTLITNKYGERKRLMQDIATFGIVEASKDLLTASRESVEKYVEAETKKINKSNLTPEEKAKKLEDLKELKARQTVKIITVGEGCDDLNVRESFPERESKENSFGPKGYSGYRDSSGNKQHIIVKTDDEILPEDEEYEDVPLYRDERRVFVHQGDRIPESILKHITEIEAKAHKPEMVEYSSEGKPKLYSAMDLGDIYGYRGDEMHVLCGEDWYYVYADDGKNIEILDFAKSSPRLEDENDDQQLEMLDAFNHILKQSVEVKDGKVKNVKEIQADLREDTSYLLYLIQKKRGIISQVGDDLKYEYSNEDETTITTPEEQQAFLKRIIEVEEGGNKTANMHKVTFKITEKTLKKILTQTKSSTGGESEND